MRNPLVKLLFILTILGLLSVYFLWERRTGVVEELATKQLGVEVTIDDIQLGFTGATVWDLNIAAHPDSSLEHSFSSEKIAIIASPTGLLWSEMVEIDDIVIESASLGVELFDRRGKDNNWTRMANYGPPPAADAKKVIVRHLIIYNMEVTVVGKGVGEKPIVTKLEKPLEMHDVGGGKPLATSEITRLIMREMMKRMTAIQILGGVTEGIIKTPIKIIEGILPGSKEGSGGGGFLKDLLDK